MSIALDLIGWLHLASSILALITGMFILISLKGNRLHKKVGYVYILSMLLVNATAFGMYRLYGKFGIFHVMAVISLFTIIAGMYPMYFSKSKLKLYTHLSFMYWSVIGLYCALMAEIFSRLPKYVLTPEGKPMTVFYKFIGIGVFVVMAFGMYFFIRYHKKWKDQFVKG
jgi:uncharacterized membrane protein